MVCSACGSEINPGARFCSACGRALTGAPFEPVQTTYSVPPIAPLQTRLVRPQQGRAIAGVCAGFARAYGWDVVVVRLVLCLAVFFGAGLPLIAYLVAWAVIPNEPHLLPPPTVQTASQTVPPGTSIP